MIKCRNNQSTHKLWNEEYKLCQKQQTPVAFTFSYEVDSENIFAFLKDSLIS